MLLQLEAMFGNKEKENWINLKRLIIIDLNLLTHSMII